MATRTWPIIVYRKGKGNLLLSYFCKLTTLNEDKVKQAISHTARRNISFVKQSSSMCQEFLMVIFFNLLILLGIYLKENLNIDKQVNHGIIFND